MHDFSKESYFWRDDEFDYSNIFSANTKDLNNTTNKGHTRTSDPNVNEQQPNQPLSEPHKDSDERKCRKDSPPKSAKLFEMPSWQKHIADQITPELWECIKTNSDPDREELCQYSYLDPKSWTREQRYTVHKMCQGAYFDENKYFDRGKYYDTRTS